MDYKNTVWESGWFRYFQLVQNECSMSRSALDLWKSKQFIFLARWKMVTKIWRTQTKPESLTINLAYWFYKFFKSPAGWKKNLFFITVFPSWTSSSWLVSSKKSCFGNWRRLKLMYIVLSNWETNFTVTVVLYCQWNYLGRVAFCWEKYYDEPNEDLHELWGF